MDANSVFVVREASGYGPVIIGALITGIFILTAAIIAYKGGLYTYFRKREHEQIMKRYLEGGIDYASAAADHALGVFIDNYRAALHIVREIKIGERPDLSAIEFRTYEQKYFEIMPFRKIEYLVGNAIFWRSVQLLFAFVDGKSIWFDTDFPQAISKVYNGQINLSPEDFLNRIKDKLEQFHEESKKYHWILVALESIASILEKETSLTWAELDKFKNRPEIKDSVKKLKDEFAKDLERLEKQKKEGREPKDEQKQ